MPHDQRRAYHCANPAGAAPVVLADSTDKDGKMIAAAMGRSEDPGSSSAMAGG
jgi:hypothetical protein